MYNCSAPPKNGGDGTQPRKLFAASVPGIGCAPRMHSGVSVERWNVLKNFFGLFFGICEIAGCFRLTVSKVTLQPGAGTFLCWKDFSLYMTRKICYNGIIGQTALYGISVQRHFMAARLYLGLRLHSFHCGCQAVKAKPILFAL